MENLTTLQNVVFSETQDPDVLPLYLDADIWSEVGGHTVRLSDAAHLDNVLSRSSLRVPRGERASFGTYFNAFPAAYWQRWTVVESVTLTLRTSGHGTVIIYRSNSSGNQQRVESRTVTGDAESRFVLPLQSFGDGGWYWFDLIASDEDFVLTGGEWATAAAPKTTGKLSIGITTYNKPDYCVRTLDAIARDAALTAEIDRIFLVDQGTQKVSEQEGFTEASANLGGRLQLIEQGNLGGSGGFSRAMAGTLGRDDSDFLLILDDDVEVETESALRALQFARFNHQPTIVGGHMFDLQNKPVMHAWAEIVDPATFVWGPSFKNQHTHDFRVSNLRQTPWMHARLDSDYNGWWMCLIPKKIIEEIGLALPVFIKWDDAEYGLRAAEHGFRTISLPGMGLWHITWTDKDDTQDWQAFFHTRNRIITGLLHAKRPKGGGLLDNSRRQDIKKLLNMQYYAVQLAVEGLKEVLDGPGKLHERMAQSMPRARALAADFPETRVYRPDDPDAPVAHRGRALPHLGPKPDPMTGLPLAVFTVKTVTKHWLRRGSEQHAPAPQLEFAKRDAFWWVIPHHRSVIVGTADGSGKAWYRHDSGKFKRLFKESGRLTRRIRRDWNSLAADYRRALPVITSPEEWRKTFEGRS